MWLLIPVKLVDPCGACFLKWWRTVARESGLEKARIANCENVVARGLLKKKCIRAGMLLSATDKVLSSFALCHSNKMFSFWSARMWIDKIPKGYKFYSRLACIPPGKFYITWLIKVSHVIVYKIGPRVAERSERCWWTFMLFCKAKEYCMGGK